MVSRTSHAGRPVANWPPFERPGLQIVLMKMIATGKNTPLGLDCLKRKDRPPGLMGETALLRH